MNQIAFEWIYFSDKRDRPSDTILFRYNVDGQRTTIVIDVGSEQSVAQLAQYVRETQKVPTIDYLVITHPDKDHVEGYKQLLDECRVKHIRVNRPWNQSDLYFFNAKKTIDIDLVAKFREGYQYVNALELAATKKSIDVETVNQGCRIGAMLVLSPTKTFYQQLIMGAQRFKDAFKSIPVETWTDEYLSNTAATSNENESSLVLYANLGKYRFLFTGDVGVLGLQESIRYASSQQIDLRRCTHYHIPHHGSQYNVNPLTLNMLLGDKLLCEPSSFQRYACASATWNRVHPNYMALNAFTRRGVAVYVTGQNTMRFSNSPSDFEWYVPTQTPILPGPTYMENGTLFTIAY